MHKSARTLALAAGASLLALSGAAFAAEADDMTIETPTIEVGSPTDVIVDEPKIAVDPVIDEGTTSEPGLIDEPKIDIVDDGAVDLTRAGDDGIIDPTERNLPGAVDNPEIMYTMMGSGAVEMADGMADNAAEQAADAAADRVVERVATTASAAAPADPE